MVEIIIVLAVLTLLFWLGFHITGALLSAAIWLFIKLPFALILGCLGLVCCITILLIKFIIIDFHSLAHDGKFFEERGIVVLLPIYRRKILGHVTGH